MRSLSKNMAGFLLLLAGVTLVIGASKPDFSLMYDARVKALQVHALVTSHFASEELFYTARSVDPKEEYYPLQVNNRARVNGRTIGVFPVLLAVLSSPLYALFGFSGLLYFGLMGLFVFLWILRTYWRFSNVALVFALLGSYILVLSLDYSEQTLFLAVILAAITAFHRGKIVWAAVFAGSSVWLRHEGIVFAFCFAGAMWYSEGFAPFGKRSQLISGRALRFVGVFLGMIGLFLLFNVWKYGLPLGPRFAANYAGHRVTLSMRLDWIAQLLFFRIKDGGIRIGLLAYMPFAAVIFAALLPVLGRLSARHKTVVLGTLCYMILLPCVAPNSGFLDWGPRYMSAAIPGILISARWLWLSHRRRGHSLPARAFQSFLMGVPVVLSLTGLAAGLASRKEIKKLYDHYKSLNADAYVFHDFSVMYYIGNDYVSKLVLCAPDQDSLHNVLDRLGHEPSVKRIALVQLRQGIVTTKALNQIRQNPVEDPMLKVDAWDERSVDKLVRKYLANVVRADKAVLTIWVGDV
ncbi:MAG: hypothetical protein HY042_02755, partial [Spirochaetia bacterium]|nr:hypothetical protein [Spirochaetia bacterium]